MEKKNNDVHYRPSRLTFGAGSPYQPSGNARGPIPDPHCPEKLTRNQIITNFSAANPLRRYLSSLSYHAYTVWLFTYSSHKDTVYPSAAFATSTALSTSFSFAPPTSFLSVTSSILLALFWAWLALFFFSLHNQHHPDSVLEDKINKPWRPLPSGRITTFQTRVLLACYYPVWFGISHHLGAIRQCIGLTVLTWYYCELGGCQQGGFARNILNAMGYSCFFAGALQAFVGTGYNVYEGKPLVWLVMICSLIFTTIHAQDFRDEKGDRARGRQTVQTTLGDRASRWVIVVMAVMWSVAIPRVLGLGWAVMGVLLSLAGVLSFFTLRCLWERTAERDCFAYKVWIGWFVACILAPWMQTGVDCLIAIV
ncbi:hypothetical protein OQA88_8629 [Cercophora sp. LCS_1]